MKNDTKKEIANITNPDYLQQQVWPLMGELADILKTPGLSPFSLMSYLLYGSNAGVEIWGAIKDGKCIGFISFHIAAAPYYSTGVCSFFYMKEKDEELVNQLYEKFPEFLKKNNLKYAMFHSQTKKIGEHFKNKWSVLGITMIKTEYIHSGKKVIKGGK